MGTSRAPLITPPLGGLTPAPGSGYAAVPPGRLSPHGAEIRARQTRQASLVDMPRQAVSYGPIWVYRGSDHLD